jgi:hypothetical protein
MREIEQLSKEQAIAIYDSEIWQNWTDDEIVRFQLFQERLAIPFDRFQMAVEAVLGRSVWTHEFAHATRIKDEYLGKRKMPTFDEIMELIPEKKRMVCVVDYQGRPLKPKPDTP